MNIVARLLVPALLAVACSAAFPQASKRIVIGQTYVKSGPLAGLSTEPLVGIRAMFEATVSMVASGRVTVKPMITKVLDGIDKVPEAFELTANKAQHGLINPAQVVISR